MVEHRGQHQCTTVSHEMKDRVTVIALDFTSATTCMDTSLVSLASVVSACLLCMITFMISYMIVSYVNDHHIIIPLHVCVKTCLESCREQGSNPMSGHSVN